jgi:transposase
MEIFTPPEVKPKRPPGRRSKHSVEYQLMVARKCQDEGMTYREAARTFGLSHGSVYAILKKYRKDGLKARRKETTTKYAKEVENYRHQNQLRELKHEIAELYLENLMLKKALSHSLRTKKERSSVITSESLERSSEDVK